MNDFYLQFKKVGNKYRLNTNLTKRMLQNIKDYNEYCMLETLSIVLKDINVKGDAAKRRYKELCEKNGLLLYNAAMILYDIYEEYDKMAHYNLYAKMVNSISKRTMGMNLITE